MQHSAQLLHCKLFTYFLVSDGVCRRWLTRNDCRSVMMTALYMMIPKNLQRPPGLFQCQLLAQQSVKTVWMGTTAVWYIYTAFHNSDASNSSFTYEVFGQTRFSLYSIHRGFLQHKLIKYDASSSFNYETFKPQTTLLMPWTQNTVLVTAQNFNENNIENITHQLHWPSHMLHLTVSRLSMSHWTHNTSFQRRAFTDNWLHSYC